jgi:hypothetical protein
MCLIVSGAPEGRQRAPGRYCEAVEYAVDHLGHGGTVVEVEGFKVRRLFVDTCHLRSPRARPEMPANSVLSIHRH